MSESAPFVDFAESLGVEFEAGQRAACRVCFDGVEPRDLVGEEREWARKLFGDVEVIPPLARAIVAWVCGGRSGKSYLFGLRGLHLALTVDLSILAPGEEAFVAIIAPSLELAEQTLRYAAGAARKDPHIRPLIQSDTAGQLLLRREDGALVALRTFAASAGGVSGRGKSLVAVILDESCFFRDKSSGVVNDETIFNAASVRVVEGGQTLVASTPWVGRGLLHSLWKRNWSKPGDALVAHAATRTMRTKPHILAIVERAERTDPDNAAIEFGADWGEAQAESFFSDDELAGAFAEPLVLGRTLRPGERSSAGGDLAFSKNAAVLAVLHELAGGDVVLAALEQRKPEPGKPLKPSKVCGDFASTAAEHRCVGVVADGHYRETLREHLDAADLVLLDGPGTAEALIALRAAMREGQVHLTGDRLRQQLASIKSRRTVGDRIQVVVPVAIDGRHCDEAVAVANAAWGLGRWGVAAEEEPTPPDAEALALAHYDRWAAERQRQRDEDNWGTAPEEWT